MDANENWRRVTSPKRRRSGTEAAAERETSAGATEADALIGVRVHSLMFLRHFTQLELAEAIGIGQASLSRKLRGDRPWRAHELILVSHVLRVPLIELFSEVIGRDGVGRSVASAPASFLRANSYR